MEQENGHVGPPNEAEIREFSPDYFLVKLMIPAYKATTLNKNSNILFANLLDPLYSSIYKPVSETPESIGRNDVLDAVKKRFDDLKDRDLESKDDLGLDKSDYMRLHYNIQEWIAEHTRAEEGYDHEYFPEISFDRFMWSRPFTKSFNDRVEECKLLGKNQLSRRQVTLEKSLAIEGKTLKGYFYTIYN
jgi:hypothetical protein